MDSVDGSFWSSPWGLLWFLFYSVLCKNRSLY
uniref:Uncharacterized protein n=1 Tax=Anguilla anguilla TaxID=7936 RepID=A0A0E9UMC8_ANGAN